MALDGPISVLKEPAERDGPSGRVRGGFTRKQVVFLVHGIRTQAEWEEKVQSLLESAGVPVETIKYGFFDVIRFWSPVFTRRSVVKRVQERLQDALALHPGKESAVIAHSFGTYAVTRVLVENPHIRIDRLLLCGSIVPRDFRWDRLPNRPAVLNECGARDIWPILAESMSWGYGASGTFGFGFPGVEDRFHLTSHSAYFEQEFVRKYWLPWVCNGTEVESDCSLVQPTTPYWRSLLPMLPLRWVLLLICCLSLLFAARAVLPGEKNPSQIVDRVCKLYGNATHYSGTADFRLELKRGIMTLTVPGKLQFFYSKSPPRVSADVEFKDVGRTNNFSLFANTNRTVLTYSYGSQYILYTNRPLALMQRDPSAEAIQDLIALTFRAYALLFGTNFQHGRVERASSEHILSSQRLLSWDEVLKAARTGGAPGGRYTVPMTAVVEKDGQIVRTTADLKSFFDCIKANPELNKNPDLLTFLSGVESAKATVTYTNQEFKEPPTEDKFDFPDLANFHCVSNFTNVESGFAPPTFR